MLQPLAMLAAFALTQATAPHVFSVDPAHSKLSYHITHKLHRVQGDSSSVEGKVAFLADGRVQLMVRAPVASFRSGDSNRDAHMLEVVEAAKYGYVTFKAATRVALPAADKPLDLPLTGELEFHGRKRTETIPLKVSFTAPGQLHASGTFDVSLDGYEVERPSLLFVKVEDNCRIELDLALTEDQR